MPNFASNLFFGSKIFKNMNRLHNYSKKNAIERNVDLRCWCPQRAHYAGASWFLKFLKPQCWLSKWRWCCCAVYMGTCHTPLYRTTRTSHLTNEHFTPETHTCEHTTHHTRLTRLLTPLIHTLFYTIIIRNIVCIVQASDWLLITNIAHAFPECSPISSCVHLTSPSNRETLSSPSDRPSILVGFSQDK